MAGTYHKGKDAHICKNKSQNMRASLCDDNHFNKQDLITNSIETGGANAFPRLMMSAVSANLRRVFALTDGLKKQARGDPDISHIEVIGAGAMGADITCYLLSKGYNLYLSDVNETAIDKAKVKIESYLQRKLTH